MNRRALQHPAPREDVVVEEPGQHSCRVQRKVVAQSRVPTKTAAPQQSWRLRRTGGDDDRVGQHVECGAVGPAGSHAIGPPGAVQDPFDPRPGDDPRAGRAGLRQGVEVHAELGVAGAADRALATATAPRRIARDGRRPPAQRLGGLQQQAPVAAHDLQRHRRNPQCLLRIVKTTSQLVGVGQAETELVTPAPLHGK
ncbi:Uncharacterised protein [Mycobacterium tuberculosis]|nr:Uncharacterised protein [Mycobacterium tuberculosis]